MYIHRYIVFFRLTHFFNRVVRGIRTKDIDNLFYYGTKQKIAGLMPLVVPTLFFLCIREAAKRSSSLNDRAIKRGGGGQRAGP